MALVAYEDVVVDDVGSSLSKGIRHGQGHNARSIHNLSSSSLRKKSCSRSLFSQVHSRVIRNLLTNMQEVLFGTKLFVLFPAVPLAIAAQCWGFGQTWVFALSLLGLTPLAERLSFLTEQISFYTGPTVGGLLNATCGNATELIVALFALHMGKIEVVKHSLVGSVLSNLLLVLGTSLLCGGLENLSMEQHFDHKQADMNTALLLLGGLCHVLTLMLRSAVNSGEYSYSTVPTLVLSRASSIVMLVTYIAYLLFQLKTHRQLYEPEEEDDNDDVVAEVEVLIGFPSALVWLVCVTILIAVLSEYAVSTIEAASESWGMPINFVSIILLPIIGNAAEHAGAIIFSLKNKLDITLGITLGSATQISMFVVPLSVIVAWIMGIPMDLDFKLLETISLVGSILITSIILRDGTSHYLKGFTLILVYTVIAACFFCT